MKLAVELYSEKTLSIREETYFKTFILMDGTVLDCSKGFDRYGFSFILTSEKRLAGLGREFIYTLSSFPAGMGPIEARPGTYFDLPEAGEISLALETNLILDPGVLNMSIGVRFVNEDGKKYDFPLCRPDVPVLWDGRGTFTISLSGILHSNVLKVLTGVKGRKEWLATC
ncbi:MAG: hypothetical protein ACOY46_02180 [Bacillota bacterium]